VRAQAPSSQRHVVKKVLNRLVECGELVLSDAGFVHTAPREAATKKAAPAPAAKKKVAVKAAAPKAAATKKKARVTTKPRTARGTAKPAAKKAAGKKAGASKPKARARALSFGCARARAPLICCACLRLTPRAVPHAQKAAVGSKKK
jgi:large subunit ribosomal protein L22e